MAKSPLKPGPRLETGARVQYISANFGYQIVGFDQLSPRFRTRAAAEVRLRRELASLPISRRPRKRSCMCCDQVFISRGAHNRLCDPCRANSQTLPALAVLATAASRVRRAARY